VSYKQTMGHLFIAIYVDMEVYMDYVALYFIKNVSLGGKKYYSCSESIFYKIKWRFLVKLEFFNYLLSNNSNTFVASTK